MRFVVKIEAMIEAKDEAEAIVVAEKVSKALAAPMAKVYFAGQQVKFIAARVDPKPILLK